jgi:hypothetical protein
LGCAASGGNAFGIYTLTDHFTDDRDLARGLTLGWFGAQSAAGFTNWLGRRNGWEDRAAFNATAIPLNYAASPFVSSLGLLWAGVGETTSGFRAEVHAYGGMLVFDHSLCLGTAANTGAVGHCFSSGSNIRTRRHEMGHQVQVAVMGDLGVLGVLGGDFLWSIFSLQWEALGKRPGYWTLEPWAKDYSETPPSQ